MSWRALEDELRAGPNVGVDAEEEVEEDDDVADAAAEDECDTRGIIRNMVAVPWQYE